MSNSTTLLRALLIYGICLPVAVFLGYLLTTPMTLPNLMIVAALFLVLLAPLFLKWHHAMVIVCWNMSTVVFFLPGSPPLWLVVALISLCIFVAKRTISQQSSMIFVPALVWPLVFMSVVVFATAFVTGGIGFTIFGSSTGGGKRYLIILGAVLGYFALTSQPVTPKRMKMFAVLYFLGGVTTAVGYLVPYVPKSMYFLFYMFPVEKSGLELIGGEIVRGGGEISRTWTFGVAATSIYCALLVAYGIRGVFSLRHWWRPILFTTAVVLSFYGGFRSSVVIFLLIFFFQFFLEGLHRTRLMLIAVLAGVLTLAGLLRFTESLPYSFQRSLSIIPAVKVDPVVAYDAKISSEWRLEMWQQVLPLIPKHLWLGKGYGLNASEMAMMDELFKAGRATSTEVAIMAGDYHNGPLSIVIPLGIYGLLGFIWLVGAMIWALTMNYKYGDPALRTVNTFLLAFMLAKLAYFIVIFGSFHTDLPFLTGIVGLSVCLNKGVRRPVRVPKPAPVVEAPQPSRLAPVGWARSR